jgi:hypothetical protein
MSKVKETFLYKSENFVNINVNAEMHSTNIKNGKGQEIVKTYKNGKLKSSRKRNIKAKEASKMTQSLLFGGSRRLKHSRSKTHKKRRS